MQSLDWTTNKTKLICTFLHIFFLFFLLVHLPTYHMAVVTSSPQGQATFVEVTWCWETSTAVQATQASFGSRHIGDLRQMAP